MKKDKDKKDEISKEQVMEVMDFVSKLDASYIKGLSKTKSNRMNRRFYSPQIQNEEEKNKGRTKVSHLPSDEVCANFN